MGLTYNTTLTNYARGIAQDRASALAPFLAPDVVTGVSSGQYKRFDDAAAFQVPDTARPIGGEATRIDFTASDSYYNCKPHALETPIDVAEREQYGEGDPLGIERGKTEMLVTNAVLAHEVRVIAAAKSLGATAGLGTNWSTGTGDPVAEINSLIQTISTNIGMMPNRIALGLNLWAILASHQAVLKRFSAIAPSVTLEQFTGLLLNPTIKGKVGILAQNTAKAPKAATKASLYGLDMFVFFASDNPTTMDVSFMKTFRTKRGGVDQVRTYQTPSGRADILAVDWTEDIQVTASVAAGRITAS